MPRQAKARARQFLPPRVLTREQAADYLGLCLSAFDIRVKNGLLPSALPPDIYGVARFDLRAIDRQLDRDSGIGEQSGLDAMDALSQWREQHGSA